MNAVNRPSRSGLWKVSGMVLASLVLSGCFSGEYKRRMEGSIQKLQNQNEKAATVFAASSQVFDAARAPSGISMRLPVFVDDKAKPLGVTAPNAQPPFCALPGFAYSYEIPLDGQPAYVYFAAVKADQKSVDELAQEVLAAVGTAFSGVQWRDVELEAFDTGQRFSAKQLAAVGSQKFGDANADGRFELYLVSSSSHHVLIGWRASQAAAGPQGFFDKVAIAMGTLTGVAG